MTGRRAKERHPVRVIYVAPRGEPDIGAVDGCHRPPMVPAELGVPGADGRVGEGVVELRVEFGRGDNVVCQAVSDNCMGETVPSPWKVRLLHGMVDDG